ncbi:MAG: hypothetical protein JW910_05010 [Anaerolineae bacterium]|nr:hypothetical protein [Anaerolineae bacterium]
MPYFPETTVVQGLVRVNRERKLPNNAIPRQTHNVSGIAIDAIQVVLQGDVMKDYRFFDVGAFFNVRDPQRIAALIQVTAGQRLQAGDELARRGRGRRAKVLRTSTAAQVVRVEDGQIILQVAERSVEIQAKIPGEIESVSNTAVTIAGNGALIQCAWGNGRFCYEAFRFLPEDGFVGLSKLDVRISEYRGVVIISPYPITKGDLLVAQQQEATGVVAPSMPSNLRNFAMQLTFPVMLTEGFGQRRPTELIYNLLQSNMGRQAAFDAVIPDRWSWNRPEIMIPLPTGGITPPVPAVDLPLDVGAQVRITRAPWDGWIGEVVELPATPQVIESGLRLPCARVRLPDGRARLVPLANLELLG